MGNDIIEFKPGIGPLKVDVLALIRRLRQWRKMSPVRVVAQRFLHLFQEHGVAISQIPRFVPQLTLATLQDVESLLSALTNDVLDHAATLFGVRRSWLEGVDDQIYETLFCYKRPRAFFDDLATLDVPADGFSVRALCTKKKLDWRSGHAQPIALVLTERVQDLGDEEVIRYRVYGDGWDWAHPPCRIQLKAMARLVFLTCGRPVPLHQVSSRVLQAIIEGECVPRAALEGCLLTDPSLEDFGLSSGESVKVRESGELPDVHDYIRRQGLEALAQQMGLQCEAVKNSP